MTARTGIIDSIDREKKRITLIWDDTKNRSLPLLMLQGLADNTDIADERTGKTRTPVEVGSGTGTLVREKDPGVPVIGRRALAVILDRAGHGVYIGMIEEGTA